MNNFSALFTGLLQLMAKWMFPTDTLQQKIEITDLKPLLAAEYTSVVLILACNYHRIASSIQKKY